MQDVSECLQARRRDGQNEQDEGDYDKPEGKGAKQWKRWNEIANDAQQANDHTNPKSSLFRCTELHLFSHPFGRSALSPGDDIVLEG